MDWQNDRDESQRMWKGWGGQRLETSNKDIFPNNSARKKWVVQTEGRREGSGRNHFLVQEDSMCHGDGIDPVQQLNFH